MLFFFSFLCTLVRNESPIKITRSRLHLKLHNTKLLCRGLLPSFLNIKSQIPLKQVQLSSASIRDTIRKIYFLSSTPMKFYANLYPVTISYTNLPKIMLSLKFMFFFFYAAWEACLNMVYILRYYCDKKLFCYPT